MHKILAELEKRTKYEFIATLRENTIRQETRLMELHSLFMKRNIKERHRAFSKWLTFVKLCDQANERAFYENSLTNAR